MLTDDHEDVQVELYEIVKDKKSFYRLAPWIWMAGFLITVVLLFGLVKFSTLFFDDRNVLVVAAVACIAFVGATIGVRMQYILQRIERIEIHALTVHNEVLRSHEKLNDAILRSGKELHDAILELTKELPKDSEALRRTAAYLSLAERLSEPRDTQQDPDSPING